METRYCIEYINPKHPLHDDGSLNIRYDRVLTLEQAENDLTLILSFGGKILDLYMGNVVDGETGEWSPKPMIIDDEDWFSTKWLNTLEVKKVQEEPVSEDNNLRKASEEYLKVLSETPYNNTPITNAQTIVRELITFLDNPSKYNPNHIEESASDGLEEASKEWLAPQLDKSYAAYGETKQMEFTHFDGYAMLDAIEFGAKWGKNQAMAEIQAQSMALVHGCPKE